jgi:hypothetical protein
MFELDEFIADLRAALAERSPQALKEVVARAVYDPAPLLRRIGEPDQAAVRVLYRGADLTVLNVIWAPKTSHITPQPPDVGSYRHVWRSGGQHVLATGF